jgi:hypothetical protein
MFVIYTKYVAFKKGLEKVTDKNGPKLIFAVLNRKLAS